MLILRLHCRSKGRIDFCDASDLRTVVFSHTVAPHQPGTLARCSASDSILLYVDDSRGDVWCLDCSTATPETWSNVIITQQEGIPHMCCLADGDKHLLITTHGTSVIHAYNTKTDELEWRLKAWQGTVGMKESLQMGTAICSSAIATMLVYRCSPPVVSTWKLWWEKDRNFSAYQWKSAIAGKCPRSLLHTFNKECGASMWLGSDQCDVIDDKYYKSRTIVKFCFDSQILLLLVLK